MPDVLELLGNLTEQRAQEIAAWFAKAYGDARPFFYSSVDLRYSGHKIAPVDTNLFPAGFNLLSPEARERGAEAVSHYFRHYHPAAKKLLLITENHTRNTYYLENVAILASLLRKAGLEVVDVPLASESITKREGILSAGDFRPDVILMNNDLSSGAPEVLQDLIQPVIPPIGLGWYQRRKTGHFDTYSDVARRFAAAFDFDPWLISTLFHKCGTVNFREKIGLECVAQGVERCLAQIRKKYAEYGITDEPYVFIKADRGTYGMGIMTVRSPEDVLEINKKERHKMDVIKEGVSNTEVIIQEGVPTIDSVGGKTAEPLLYLMNGEVVGSTFRINESRDAFSNLNAPGMAFTNVCESDGETASDESKLCPVRSLIARLATLAATMESYEAGWDI